MNWRASFVKMFVVSPLSSLVNNRYVLTSFPRFEIDRFLTTGCCLVIQRALGIIHFLFSTPIQWHSTEELFCSDGTNDGVMRRWYSKMILLDSMAASEREANTWKDDPLFAIVAEQKSSIVLSFFLRHSSTTQRCSFVNVRKCGKIFQACRKIGNKHILPKNYIRKLTHLLAMAQVENAGKEQRLFETFLHN